VNNPFSYLPGIDVSHWNGVVDWQSVAKAGIQFAYLKATDGATGVDKTHALNCQRCKDAGIKRGSYHFYRNDVPVHEQFNNFEAELNLSDVGDIPEALDVEVGPMDQAELDNVYELLTELREELNVTPVLYIDLSNAVKLTDDRFAEFPLWLADYRGIDPPVIPGTVNIKAQWKFWQHTPAGSVAGIANAVDLDWFNGTIDQLDFNLRGEEPGA
jgi:lysozyme